MVVEIKQRTPVFDWVNWRPINDKKPEAGLGDTVANVIHAVTRIRPCPDCERRRKWLNRKFPYKKK